MDLKPLVSVIIPSYNRAHLIKDAVNSVLQQTYDNIEVIVVDDCSTDNTKETVESISDFRVKYYRLEKNSGACIARNKGIENAKGEYISFNDSDDKWLPNKIESQLSFLQSSNADVVLCKMHCMTPDGEFIHDFPKYNENISVSYESILEYNCSSTQTIFAKASCIKDIMFDPSMPRLQDWDEVIRLTQKYKVFYQNEILVNTFFQKDSISTHPERGVIAMEKLFEKHKDFILANKKITESFFKKKASFVRQTKKSDFVEMQMVFSANKCLKNLLMLIRSSFF